MFPDQKDRRGSFRPAVRCLALLVVLATIPSTAWSREKVDVLVLVNGDRITGEIKKLERAVLTFTTDSLDRVYVDWLDIARLTSPFTYQIEVSDGTVYFGRFDEPVKDGVLRVLSDDASVVELDMPTVIRIDPIGAGFWSRLDGSLGVGYSYTRSSDVTQFSFEGDVSYRTRRFVTTLDASAVQVDQEAGNTNRQDYSVATQRLLPDRWYSQWFIQAQKNRELGLDLRTLLGSGMGRHLVQGNKATLSLLAGFVFTREREIDVDDVTRLTEVVGAVDYELFRLKSPEVNVSAQLTIYRTITEIKRVRGEFELSSRYELIKDFFLQLTIYDSYTSQPPTNEAEKNDYGVTTSIGYNF